GIGDGLDPQGLQQELGEPALQTRDEAGPFAALDHPADHLRDVPFLLHRIPIQRQLVEPPPQDVDPEQRICPGGPQRPFPKLVAARAIDDANAGQWLSRGMLLAAIRWYLTAASSTAPPSNWPTIPRWISCQGVCDSAMP